MTDNPFAYPEQKVTIHSFDGTLAAFFPAPQGELHEWPPMQLRYLEAYLKELGCAAVVHEAHYVDRDYIEDLSLFYSRSLRNYPNHCRRLHFFSRPLSDADWQAFMVRARQDYDAACRELTDSYLGFTVIRPLPGRPVGRTVLAAMGPTAIGGSREFKPLRPYKVHLSGLELRVTGLAFQQQDQGVSACATTATWTALQSIAHRERMMVRTPAEITLAASRYLLANGRALPSEGLGVQQICEAVRDAGLAPVLLPANSFTVDRSALDTYLRSGFPAILAVMPCDQVAGEAGHAICAVGVKVGEVQPQADDRLNYRDGASALMQVYVHDDRMGPYAAARLSPFTEQGNPTPQLSFLIRWPGGNEGDVECVVLHAIVIPVPNKIRLSPTRLAAMGQVVGSSLSDAFPQMERTVTIQFRYSTAVDYAKRCFASKLSQDGLRQLVSTIALPRYVAIVEVSGLGAPLIDVVLDCTESVEQPSVVAVVNHSDLPAVGVDVLRTLANIFAAPFIE